MLAIFAGCSKQVEFSKLSSYACKEPISFIENISDTIHLNAIIPLMDNVDSVTCENANVVYSSDKCSSFIINPLFSDPFYLIRVWSDGSYFSLLAINSELKGKSDLFITSDLDNRERIVIRANSEVEQWKVFWQNMEIPSSSLEVSDNSVIVPVPENAREYPKSEIRTIAFSNGIISNSSIVTLSQDHVCTDFTELKADENGLRGKSKLPLNRFSRVHKDKYNELLKSRAEWNIGDVISIIDDTELLVYARTYMGITSFFAFNKSANPVERKLNIPHNIKMGNLKTYFDQSIKQTGDKIVINLCPNSYEIATSEIL